MPTPRRWSLVATLVLSAGCYSGVHDTALSQGAGLGDSADDGGDDGAPDDDDDPRTQCGEDGQGRAPLRRLTRKQYIATVRDLLSIDVADMVDLGADERTLAFASNGSSPIDLATVSAYMTAAETIADAAAADLETTTECATQAIGTDACADAFIGRFVTRAYRRSIDTDRHASYRALFDDARAANGFVAGIGAVVAAALQSPYFMYQVETGELDELSGLVVLDDFSLAARMSYLLWNTMPDDVLLEAAAQGRLGDAERLRAQAERMLDHERARASIANFHVQWLDIEHLAAEDKNAELFPDFAALAPALLLETIDFADFVIRKGDGRLATLLSASESVLSPGLADLYGVAVDAPGELVPLPNDERAGLLTHASVLASHAHADQSSPIKRGVFIRKRLLCSPPPAPPPDVNDNPPPVDPDATTRERFQQHTDDAACAGCHALIDPLGFGLENYDAIGRYRTHEGGLTIDASGEVIGAGDADGEFVGGVELANRLADSEQVRRCVTTQWFRYGLRRAESKQDSCSIDAIYARFAESDFSLRELLLATATSDAFRLARRED